MVFSCDGLVGDLDVNCIDVRGKVEELGFPANREIKPGRDSSGYKPRTRGGKGFQVHAASVRRTRTTYWDLVFSPSRGWKEMESKTRWEDFEGPLYAVRDDKCIRTQNCALYYLVFTVNAPKGVELDFQCVRRSKRCSVRIFSSSADSGSAGGK